MSEVDIWADRRVKIGYETAEELAHCYNRENWRSHPANQRAATEESLDTLGLIGQVKKSTVNNLMFDGHLRVELALAKNPQMLLPVDYYDLNDDETALALTIHDAITEQAEPIPDKLAALLERTRALTADRPGLGAMLAVLKVKAGINGNGQTPAEAPPMVDKAEELQAKWQVKPGDLFEFPSLTTPGRFHRLLCGDCRNPDDMMRLTDGQQVNGVFTSPPYAEQRKAQYGGVPVGEYVEWWGAVQTNVRGVLAEDGSFFVNIKEHCDDGQRVLYCKKLVIAMVEAWGWRFVDELCWKRASAPSSTDERLRNEFEPIYHFSTGKIKARLENVSYVSSETNSGNGQMSRSGSGFNIAHWEAGMVAKPSNVLTINHNNDAADLGQPATFPVALPTFFIRAYSDPGDIWLDPFCGSGTVLVSCEREGRIGLGTEILPKYCAVICERLSTTGQTPHRVSG